MATDLSSIAGGLKRVYDDYSEQQQNLKARARDQISKSLKKYSPEGEGYFGAINDYGNESGGAINETESFRTIDNENYTQYKVTPKVVVWPIEFGGLTAAAASGDEASFGNLILDALDKAKDRLESDENRQFFGLGNGYLAAPSISVTAAGVSFTVDSVQYLRRNMVIDIFSGATKTVDSYRISYIDRVNNIVGLLTSIGVAIDTTTAIVKENIRDSAPSDGKEAMGLRGIVDDSTDLTTFENIHAGNSYEWRARRISAASANLTSDLLQRLIDDVEILSGEEPDMLIMHRRQRRKYLDLVVPQKRFQDGKMDAGFSDLKFNGTYELFLDKDCQTDTVYAVRKNKLRLFELQAVQMGRYDGSDSFLRKVGTDTYQGFWRHYFNWGTPLRRAHGKIVSLAVPTGVS